MRIKMFSVIAVSAVVFIAASADSLTDPAVERNNPGTGSGTLDVRADVNAFDEAGGFVTEFSVRVRDGLGNPITGAAVTIANTGFGEVTLLDPEATGNYVAERHTFHGGDFTLSIVSGEDVVEGVVLGGPGIHTISGVAVDSPVPAGQDLRLRWDVPSQARSAEVETRDYGPLLLPDTGAVIIPGASNPARVDQRIRVFRFNEVDVAGGLYGSRMRVEVRQSIDLAVVESEDRSAG
jgi:hypothetical protein